MSELNPAAIREFLAPLKQQGVSWERAWTQCHQHFRLYAGNRSDTLYHFTYDVMKKAYTDQPLGDTMITADMAEFEDREDALH